MGYVSAAFSIMGGLSSMLAGAKARRDARVAADNEAMMEGHVTDAKIKSLDVEQRTLAGQTQARAAGSNVKIGTGSPLQILAEQARNFADEKRIVRQAGATKAAQAQTRGKMVGNQAFYGGLSNAFGSFGNAFSMISAQSQSTGP
mgnify:CR=1 FL=1